MKITLNDMFKVLSLIHIYLLLVKPERREGDLCIEQPKSLLPQSFTRQEQMSFAALAVLQRPEQCLSLIHI